MTDRIPGAPGRCKAVVTGEELQKLQSGEEFAITLRRDDQPILEGTPYNKASVLPDELAARLCPDLEDPAPKDAFAALHNGKADTGRIKRGGSITLNDAVNAPLMGLRIFGNDHVGEDGYVHSVGENGSVTVYLMGKNLADVRKYSAWGAMSAPDASVALTNNYGTTISANTGDSIVVEQTKASGTVNSYTNGYFGVGFYCPLKTGDKVTVSYKYKATTNPLNNSFMSLLLNGQSVASTSVKDAETGLYYHAFTVTNAMEKANNWHSMEFRIGGKSGVFSEFQVALGSTYTGYAPYQDMQTLTIPTPGGLLGDENVYDEIDFAKGVMIRRCAEWCEIPLSDTVLEKYRQLQTYAPTTVITNGENAILEVHYCTPGTALLAAQDARHTPWIYNAGGEDVLVGNYRRFRNGICVANGTIPCIYEGMNESSRLHQGLYEYEGYIPFPVAFAEAPVVNLTMEADSTCLQIYITDVAPSFVLFKLITGASRDISVSLKVSAIGMWQ